MSERNPRPSNSDKIQWPAATYGTADPSSQRAAGWAPNEVPDAEEFNFLQKMWGEEFVWNLGYLAREWADLHEASPSSMSVGELLAVVPPTTGANARGSAVFSGVSSGATGGGNIYHLCTDGEFGYYVSGGGGASQTRIVKFAMASGSLLAQAEAYSGNTISSLAVDSSAVFTMGANAADTGLTRRKRSDLSSPTSAGSEYGCIRMVANGYHLAAIAPNSGVGKVVVYSNINGTISEDGTYDTSSNMHAVAIDAENCYIGGVRSTYDVWAIVLTSRAHTWRTILPTSSTPTVDGIAADGDHVYVSTDRVGLTAGGSANLHCLDRMTGAVLWSADIGSGSSDLTGLSLDDKYLYTGDGTTVFQIDKCTTGVVQHMAAGTGLVYENVADGVSLLTTGATIATFSRFWTHPQGRKLFVRMDESDPWRMPFPHIVNPG